MGALSVYRWKFAFLFFLIGGLGVFAQVEVKGIVNQFKAELKNTFWNEVQIVPRALMIQRGEAWQVFNFCGTLRFSGVYGRQP